MSDEYLLTPRQADQARADSAALADDLDFIRKRPKREDLKISSYPRFHVRPARGALLAILAFAITSIASDPSHAATPSLTILVSFNGTDGWQPSAGLTADAKGNLFGTTAWGGVGFIPTEDPSSPVCCWPENAANGTVFEIVNKRHLRRPDGYTSTPTTLVSFNGTDGATPTAGLIADASGNLFGTTYWGGVYSYGTVFEIAKTTSGYASTPTVLYNFGSSITDGEAPTGLIADSSGNLFGITMWGGGHNDAGTVFEIVKTAGGYASTPTTLVSFNGTDGAVPEGGLIADASGNLFGTTYEGGAYGGGTVFEIAKTASGYASTPTTLVSFNGTDGFGPSAGLIADAKGDLFGMTQYDGAYAYGGYGTVFEIAKTASGYASTPTTLVSFNGTDGAEPTGGLIVDAKGNLFGTTQHGGFGTTQIGVRVYGGYGTVFEIAKTASGYASTPTTLISFNSPNGEPVAGLIADSSGNLFGTTVGGGADEYPLLDYGTVFEVTDSGFVPPPLFAGTPGKPNCRGQSVWTLAQQYGWLRPGERATNRDGGLAAAAAALGYSSAPVLQNAIAEYCAG